MDSEKKSSDIYVNSTFLSKNMVVAVLFVIILSVLVFFVGRLSGTTNFNFNTNPTVESLTKIGQLAGLKVFMGDVLTVQTEGGAGVFNGIQGVWIIKGDALLSTDMEKAEIELNHEQKNITLILQEPSVISPRVDHTKTKQYALESGFFESNDETAKLHQNAMLQAQKSIEHAASLPDYRQVAKHNIESMIRVMINLSFVDWEVKIEWRDPSFING